MTHQERLAKDSIADAINEQLPIIAIAQVATESYLAAILAASRNGDDALAKLKADCQSSVYWPKFVQAVNSGAVERNLNWVPGALGRVVVGWAKEGGSS